jgi:hypothetical protein
MNEHEEGFVKAFIAPHKRERYLQLLGNANRRSKLLGRLSRSWDIDGSRAEGIPADQRTPPNVVRLLRQKGAGAVCHVMADASELDGKEAPLGQAVSALLMSPHGAVLSIVPGHLALYTMGDSLFGCTYILERAEGEPLEKVAEEPPESKDANRGRPTYMAAISEPLCHYLEHAAGLPAHYLAGHAGNLGFWMDEVRHCLRVIDGYLERYDRLKQGTRVYEKRHYGAKSSTTKRSLADDERWELRTRLCRATEQFLGRCVKEGLVDKTKLAALCAEFGIEGSEKPRHPR